MAKVIAVANQKGGCSKTSVVANLGIGLAMEGKKVAVIDADPQGSLTASLGYQEPDDIRYTLATIMMNIINEEEIDPMEGILHHEEGVDLVPANIELSGLEVSLSNVMSWEMILKEYVEQIRDQYDYILIDCMPSLRVMTINRFTLEIGGFFNGYAKYKYTISGDHVLFDADHSFYLKPSNLPVYEPFSREEFIRDIADLHIGEWKERYENLYVLDGTQWSISIEYEDGKEPLEIYGSNAYPYNFEELIDFLGIDNSDTDEMGDDYDTEEDEE